MLVTIFIRHQMKGVNLMTDDNLTDDNLTVDDADEALFGVSGQRGTVIEKISIRLIWADLVQPRRTIPAEIRGDWLGSPQKVPELLKRWHQVAEKRTGKEIEVTRLVLGNDSVSDEVQNDIVAGGFVELCELAATIAHDGLTNAITVANITDGTYLIETGERRWLAHHLLLMFADDRFEMIDAKIVGEVDVHRQSAENAARRGLNAVAKARQLALLIMDMYGAESFKSYNICVAPGECDRNFYIQAVNSDIKRGHAPRLMVETGFANRQMVSRYRDILNLPDDVWVQADEENWSEKRCRDYLDDDRRQAAYEKMQKQHIKKAEAIFYNIDDAWAWVEAHELADRLEREADNLAQIAENEGISDGDMLPDGDISDFEDKAIVMTPDGIGTISMFGMPASIGCAKVFLHGAYSTKQYFISELQLVIIMPGDWVRTTVDGDALVSYISHDGIWAYIWLAGDQNKAAVAYEALSLVKIDVDDEPVISDIINQSDEVDEQPDIQVGDMVQVQDGDLLRVIRVVSVLVVNHSVLCDLGNGVEKYFDIARLTTVGRNTVVEPVAGDDTTKSKEQSWSGLVGDRVITPRGQGVVTDYHNRQKLVNVDISGVGFTFLIDEVEVVDDDASQEDDVYVPETDEDARSAVNMERPELGRLLDALSSYYHDCDSELGAEIPINIDHLMLCESAIRHDVINDWGRSKEVNADLKIAKKMIRSYLERIADHIDGWADELIEIADGYHDEQWGDD